MGLSKSDSSKDSSGTGVRGRSWNTGSTATCVFTPEDVTSLEDFQRLPTVAKEEINAAYPGQVRATGADPDNYLISVSSGSTYKTLKVVQRGDAVGITSLALYRLAKSGMRYRPHHKMAYINILGSRPCGSGMRMMWSLE